MSDSPPPRRRRRQPGPLDMVITMAVLLGAVALLLLLVPAPRAIVQPGVDPAQVADSAVEQLGFEPSVVSAEDLGDGWAVDYARVEDAEGVTQWRVGYFGPAGRRVDLEQAVDVSERWLTRSDTPLDARSSPGEGDASDADPLAAVRAVGEEVSVGGRSWVSVLRGDGDQALALVIGAGEAAGAADAAATPPVVTVLSTSSPDGLGDLERVAIELLSTG